MKTKIKKILIVLGEIIVFIIMIGIFIIMVIITSFLFDPAV